MTDSQPTEFERVAARRAAGLDKHDHPPVVVRPGDATPALTGDRWHYETRGGTRIDHPHAYSQVGWSSMVYCTSTRRVEVGDAAFCRFDTRCGSSSATLCTSQPEHQRTVRGIVVSKSSTPYS